VAIVHDAINEMIRAHLSIVHIFHAYASVDTPWVAPTLYRCTLVRYGRIPSVSVTHEATQFVGPHEILCVLVHYSYLLAGARRSVLNQLRWGLPPWSSKFMIQATLNLPIQYSPLSSNCPVQSHFNPFYHLFHT
jgi:hypothetical protein